jgi:hypothetical protein
MITETDVRPGAPNSQLPHARACWLHRPTKFEPLKFLKNWKDQAPFVTRKGNLAVSIL